jgi:phage terminase large subunit-like protein
MPSPRWTSDGSDIPDPFGRGQRAVDFLRLLKHPKSTAPGKAFQLDAWQERIVRRIYGPCHPDGRRQVRTVFMLLPRGNRKTSLGAGLALLHTIGPERVPGGQVISAAADRKQARIAYEEAIGIIREEPRISAAVRLLDYKNRVAHPKSGAVYEAISCDAGTQHGRTPTFVLADELHAWKKRDLWDVLRTGLVKVPGALQIIITTAGRGQANVAHEIYDYARRVAAGEVDDPGFLPVLFEAPRECDWRDEATWHEVNPGLAHGYPDLEGLRQLAREAEARPADREAFRQLHLNVWLDHSADPFVDMSIYDEGADPIDDEELEGFPCWIAIDASTTTDLTAVVACFRDSDDFLVRAWFFVPADNLRARADRDGVPYPRWAEEGFITATPGNVVDYRAVEAHVRELAERFQVMEITADPAYSRQITGPLIDDGYPVTEFRQGWRSMGPAIAELERAIIGRTFRHGGNPVLRWCFDNVAVQDDGKGNRSFHKGKSRDRIDGAVAAAMAVARAAAGAGGSVYEGDERPDGLLFI